jgi:hypothetical protein
MGSGNRFLTGAALRGYRPVQRAHALGQCRWPDLLISADIGRRLKARVAEATKEEPVPWKRSRNLARS